MALTEPDDLIPPDLTMDEPEPFTLEQLDAELATDHDDESLADAAADHTVERWQITCDDEAEWAMAHVAAIDANVATLGEQRKARIARINRWHDDAVRRLTPRRSFFAAHLVRYAERFRARDPKRNKTLHLVNGAVKSSDKQPTVKIMDAETVARWALEHMNDDDAGAVVKLDALVSELRKRTKIVLRPVGYVVTLECGHEHHVGVVNPATGAPHTEASLHADGMVCDQCDPDPIDGWLHRKVTSVGNWDERRVVMPTDDGNVDVPGAGIDPGGLEFTVKPS
jgi:hypothetical protein